MGIENGNGHPEDTKTPKKAANGGGGVLSTQHTRGEEPDAETIAAWEGEGGASAESKPTINNEEWETRIQDIAGVINAELDFAEKALTEGNMVTYEDHRHKANEANENFDIAIRKLPKADEQAKTLISLWEGFDDDIMRRIEALDGSARELDPLMENELQLQIKKVIKEYTDKGVLLEVAREHAIHHLQRTVDKYTVDLEIYKNGKSGKMFREYDERLPARIELIKKEIQKLRQAVEIERRQGIDPNAQSVSEIKAEEAGKQAEAVPEAVEETVPVVAGEELSPWDELTRLENEAIPTYADIVAELVGQGMSSEDAEYQALKRLGDTYGARVMLLDKLNTLLDEMRPGSKHRQYRERADALLVTIDRINEERQKGVSEIKARRMEKEAAVRQETEQPVAKEPTVVTPEATGAAAGAGEATSSAAEAKAESAEQIALPQTPYEELMEKLTKERGLTRAQACEEALHHFDKFIGKYQAEIEYTVSRLDDKKNPVREENRPVYEESIENLYARIEYLNREKQKAFMEQAGGSREKPVAESAEPITAGAAIPEAAEALSRASQEAQALPRTMGDDPRFQEIYAQILAEKQGKPLTGEEKQRAEFEALEDAKQEFGHTYPDDALRIMKAHYEDIISEKEQQLRGNLKPHTRESYERVMGRMKGKLGEVERMIARRRAGEAITAEVLPTDKEKGKKPPSAENLSKVINIAAEVIGEARETPQGKAMVTELEWRGPMATIAKKDEDKWRDSWLTTMKKDKEKAKKGVKAGKLKEILKFVFAFTMLAIFGTIVAAMDAFEKKKHP